MFPRLVVITISLDSL